MSTCHFSKNMAFWCCQRKNGTAIFWTCSENFPLFCGYTGKPAGYMILFSYCAVAYIIGWCFMKGLVPKYRKVEL